MDRVRLSAKRLLLLSVLLPALFLSYSVFSPSPVIETNADPQKVVSPGSRKLHIASDDEDSSEGIADIVKSARKQDSAVILTEVEANSSEDSEKDAGEKAPAKGESKAEALEKKVDSAGESDQGGSKKGQTDSSGDARSENSAAAKADAGKGDATAKTVSVPESVYLLRPKVSDWDAKRAAHIASNPGCNRTSQGKPRVMMVTGSNSKPCGEHGESDFLLLKFLKNKQDYARMHNLPIFYGLGAMNQHFPSFWVKIPLLRMLMLKYPEVEWFFWVDSDAMITDMAFEYPIHEYSSYTMVLSGFPDTLFKQRDWVAINTGIFFIRNCQDGLDFLDDWSTFGSSEAVRSQWGTVASQTLNGRADWPVDDQTALVLLLLGEGETPESKTKGVTPRKDKWLPRISIDWRTTLHGYWVSFIDKLEEIQSKQHNGQGNWEWPFTVHFVGCKLCTRESADYDPTVCNKGIHRAFAFAENQVLTEFGLHHANLSESAISLIQGE
ncbi:hypothetical protein CLOM_g1952 [Closterium sp. NIES-68]|nr:hypothetical protein CLOM_g1952 [Closterium sp. NIES-68]